MITAVPLPQFGPLLCRQLAGAPDHRNLARPWLQEGDLGGVWLSRSAWSLAVIADAFQRQHGRPPVIAIPEYFCNQSLWPLRQGRASIVFYPIDAKTLQPDWEQSRQWPDLDIFVLVHYFGWAGDGAGARVFCDTRGAMLIEDGAHALGPGAGIGQHGDAVLYSPYKMLAIPDGAVLVSRPGLSALQDSLKHSIAALGMTAPSTRIWRGKRLLQKMPFWPLLDRLHSSGQADFSQDPETLPLAATPGLSPLAAALLARTDLAKISQRRNLNAQSLLNTIHPLADWKPLFALDNCFPPYRLAMRCATEAEAIRVFNLLRQARLPVESWPDLAPEIPLNSTARRLRDTLIFLPCHQGLHENDLACHYGHALESSR